MSIARKILGELLAAENCLHELPRRFTADSREVTPGTGFAAIPGSRCDGHDFIPAALEKGASLIVMERPVPLPDGVSSLLVRDCSAAFALLVRHCAGDPDLSLKLLGVTGTNGKTTTAFLLEHIFDFSHTPCGLISTVEYRTGGEIIPGERTTPDSLTLFSLFAEMKKNGLTCAAMELSSHSLVQNRAAGIRLAAGIFTNLTGDHLDYHGDMENYYQAKKQLFTRFLRPDGTAVINADDPYGARLCRELEGRVKLLSFSAQGKGVCQIRNCELSSSGVHFVLHHPQYGELPLCSNLTGFYNIQNLSGAAIAALETGIPPEKLTAALKEKIRVPGRLESFFLPNGSTAFVDYAHTDDALINVLTALRKITSGKLCVLFGAGGDRDRTKRPRMGQAAACHADRLFVTSDNPRSEDPLKIIEDIMTGIPDQCPCQVIPDRREAIKTALESLEKEDALLVAGKGHESYQEICGVKHRFSDMEEIEKFIKENS